MEELSRLHPFIVHFPITLFTVYFLFELLAVLLKKEFLSKSAQLILLFGIIAAFGAVLTGNQAFSSFKDWEPASLQIFNEHQTFANITTWYFFTLLMGRTYLVVKKKFSFIFQVIILAMAAIGLFFVLQTGYYGGELVNKFGINNEFRTQIENK